MKRSSWEWSGENILSIKRCHIIASCCSGVYESKESAESAALSLANEIASKSPVAVQGSKVNLNYSRDHPVDDALEYAVSK